MKRRKRLERGSKGRRGGEEGDRKKEGEERRKEIARHAEEKRKK